MIINPNSGPGATQFPDADYTAAVEKLSTYDNALMVGYVRTGYATRNISTVIAEVDTYAGWSSNSSALTMHGIFFDEAPYNYSQDAVDFMHTVNQVVKNSTGLHGPRLVSASLFRDLLQPRIGAAQPGIGDIPPVLQGGNVDRGEHFPDSLAVAGVAFFILAGRVDKKSKKGTVTQAHKILP